MQLRIDPADNNLTIVSRQLGTYIQQNPQHLRREILHTLKIKHYHLRMFLCYELSYLFRRNRYPLRITYRGSLKCHHSRPILLGYFNSNFFKIIKNVLNTKYKKIIRNFGLEKIYEKLLKNFEIFKVLGFSEFNKKYYSYSFNSREKINELLESFSNSIINDEEVKHLSKIESEINGNKINQKKSLFIGINRIYFLCYCYLIYFTQIVKFRIIIKFFCIFINLVIS